MDVEIYSKTNCIFCDKAKMRLANKNPKIHMLDQDYTREDFFKKISYSQNLSSNNNKWRKYRWLSRIRKMARKKLF